jgi:hypothetical protein
MKDALHHEVLTPVAAEVLRTLGPACESLGFHLAGGTAVALRLGHRRSVDLDWFCESERFDAEAIREAVEGTGIDLAIGEAGPGTLHGSVDGVAVSFLRYRYGLVGKPSWLGDFGCHAASIEDLLCMKLAAVAGRGAKKDLFDVVALCSRCIPLDRALELFGEKYRMRDTGHVVLSLAWFDDAELDPDPALLDSPSWEEAKAWLATEVRRLAAPRRG